MKYGQIFFTIFFFLWLLSAIPAVNDCSAYSFMDESGIKETGQATGHASISLTQRSPAQMVGMIIKVLLSFLGVVFLIIMIYAGYSWMIARGNEQVAEKAKGTIVNATIGLIIIMLAYAITVFIGGQLAGSTAVG
ncbi:MAG: hypothetical protein V1867_03465 [Candidatus Falkowbacteria bacterium]